jgi:lipoate-protein ligase A
MQMKYSFVAVFINYASLYQIWLHIYFSFRTKHALMCKMLIIRRSNLSPRFLTSIRSKMPNLTFNQGKKEEIAQTCTG